MTGRSKQPHLLRQLRPADYLTLSATGAILASFWLLWSGEVELAVAIAFVSMFFDYLDGTVARKYGGSPYGKVLDSLYDVLGFVLFPALVVNIEAHWTWWAITITTVYCLSAVVRLSRFTIAGYVESDKRQYVGVPVLFSKYALLAAFVWDAALAAGGLALMVPLMVSSQLVRKPHPLFSQLNLVYAAFFLILYLGHG